MTHRLQRGGFAVVDLVHFRHGARVVDTNPNISRDHHRLCHRGERRFRIKRPLETWSVTGFVQFPVGDHEKKKEANMGGLRGVIRGEKKKGVGGGLLVYRPGSSTRPQRWERRER